MADDTHPLIGSSPLTRGKPVPPLRAPPASGLIPAHAGKTRTSLRASRLRAAHPRSRGENVATAVPEGASTWLIPAHAGKTDDGLPCFAVLRAHPRSRGENGSACSMISVKSGSSPLTRGKQTGSGERRCPRRLIPAHAGKTVDCGQCLPAIRAHPRSRGENVPGSHSCLLSWGSSPLTRGKRSRSRRCGSARRLIPAHAGKTLPDLRFYCADRSDLGNP